MEFSWATFLSVVVVNVLCVGVMYVLQEVDLSLPPRHSLIPGTNQKFLYMQDFYTCLWGDLLGVPLIANAFMHLARNGFITAEGWFIFTIIVIVDGVGFLEMCLGKNHKPDQGFPAVGQVSWHGLSHLPYHGVGVAMSLFCIWHIIVGNLKGVPLYLGLAGGAIYIAFFIADIKTHNFDPLKKN